MKSDLGYMIRGITFNMTSFIGKHVKKYGINQGQMDYFLLIAQMPGINQLELARFKNVGKASVTKALKILETDGLVRREIDPEDRRNIKCYITDKGKENVDDLMTLKKEVEKEIFNGFTDEELDKFREYLGRLYQNSENLEK